MDLRVLSNNSRQAEARGTFSPVRSPINARALSVAELAAIALPVGVALFERGSGWLWTLVAAVLTTLLWQRVFADARRRRLNPDGLIVAIVCAIALPTSASLWQVALSLSFGIVVGQEIFGGRGRNFLNPATVALAFFIFSFPGVPLDAITPRVGLAVIPGAVLLLAIGLISWRVVAGAFLGLAVVATVTVAGLPPVMTEVPASFLFVVVFLAADPVAAASTNPGRWVYGLFFGGVTALLAGAEAPRLETVVLVALLAGVFAPLIDSGALAVHAYQRRRRDERA